MGRLQLVSRGARTIRPNPLVPTGYIASAKNDCMSPNNSNLERDYAILLEFAADVGSYLAQPLQLSFRDRLGRTHPGWPDFLVNYRERSRPNQLVDVKYRSDLFKNWRKLKPRLKAALAYALERGWIYRIKTEKEIRTPLLQSARFLLRFRREEPNAADVTSLLAALSTLGESTPARLLEELSDDRWRRAELMPTLWHLMSRFQVAANLDSGLNMNSTIWVAQTSS